MIEVLETVIVAIEDHARDAYPEECCGFLLGRAGGSARVLEAVRAKNVASEDRRRRFVIDPLELLRADDAARAKGLDLVGIYHSHPNHPAEPSEYDRGRATGWYAYVILGIEDREPGELTAWRFDDASRRFNAEKILRRRSEA